MFDELFFFFMQKSASQLRISGWSADVCSSDLAGEGGYLFRRRGPAARFPAEIQPGDRLLQHPGERRERHDRSPAGGDAVRLRNKRRSAERRAGTESDSTCRSRWSAYAFRTKNSKYNMTTGVATNQLKKT